MFISSLNSSNSSSKYELMPPNWFYIYTDFLWGLLIYKLDLFVDWFISNSLLIFFHWLTIPFYWQSFFYSLSYFCPDLSSFYLLMQSWLICLSLFYYSLLSLSFYYNWFLLSFYSSLSSSSISLYLSSYSISLCLSSYSIYLSPSFYYIYWWSYFISYSVSLS